MRVMRLRFGAFRACLALGMLLAASACGGDGEFDEFEGVWIGPLSFVGSTPAGCASGSTLDARHDVESDSDDVTLIAEDGTVFEGTVDPVSPRGDARADSFKVFANASSAFLSIDRTIAYEDARGGVAQVTYTVDETNFDPESGAISRCSLVWVGALVRN